MSEQRIVAFDLETVPDVNLARPLLDAREDETDSDVRLRLGQRYSKEGQDPELAFVKLPLHKIICIGALYAERPDRLAPWVVSRSGVGHTDARSERQLVEGFVDSLNDRPGPQLIGFNSSSFDLPVLRYRALALSISVPGLHRANGRDYWYRFGRDHIDLCDVLSNFGASAKPSLNEAAALCRLPGKVVGIDGSQVEPMLNAGKLDEVAQYCESDVLTTYLLFLRYCLIVGDLSPDSHLLSIVNFKSFLDARVEKRPHLNRFLEALASIPTTSHQEIG